MGALEFSTSRRMKLFFCKVIGICLLGWHPFSLAVDSIREQEMAQCLPGEISTWADGQDRPAVTSPLLFVYKHDDAPAWFDAQLVLSKLIQATAAWSECLVPSRVVLGSTGTALPSGAVVVQWSEEGSRRNFGLANLGERTLSLGPAAFTMLNTRNPAFDASQTLQMVISHEMGHFFGLMAHSKRCVDVTSYYSNGKGDVCSIRGGAKLPPGVEYRALLPTACDLQRCRLANGKPLQK